MRPIEGGVCAPVGYKANAISIGLREDGGLDYAMILSEKRCAVATVYADGNSVGGPVKVSKKNMRYGYARAMLVNSGIANCIGADSEKFAYSVCDVYFAYGLERTEIVLASTGKIGAELQISPFEKGARPLLEGLAASHENSLRVAEAIRSENSYPKQLSFAFDLGDYPCKIGVVFKGGAHTAPNMATFLAFLTTDVNISSPMLQKALESAVNETLNLINLDGMSSPNDTVCIFANGKAGNYKITCEDSEYKKFVFILRKVLTEVCRVTAMDGAQKLLLCKVCGARSKEVTRAVSKTIVGLDAIKRSILKREIDTDAIFYTLLEKTHHDVVLESLHILIRSGKGEFYLYADKTKYSPSPAVLQNILSAFEVEIEVDYGEGNYSSTAYGQI